MSRTRVYLLLVALTAAVVGLVGCAGNNPPQVAANIADRGTTLMKAVQAAQDAVIAAEASGTLPRNAAVSSMEVFKRIGAAGTTLSEYLRTYASLAPNSSEASTLRARIQEALDLIDSQIFQVLVPIADEGVRKQVSELAAQVSRLVTIINRQLLGGV